MSKIRVYQLAKQLDLDNKIVVDKAIELGIPGVTSHSNSLDSDQVETITKALKSSNRAGAAGSATLSNTGTHKDKMFSYIDQTTGNTVTEQRKGTVVRRRKSNEGVSALSTPTGLSTDDNSATSLQYSAEATESFSALSDNSENLSTVEVTSESVHVASRIEDGEALPSSLVKAHSASVVTIDKESIPASPTVSVAPTTSPAAGPRILGRIDLSIGNLAPRRPQTGYNSNRPGGVASRPPPAASRNLKPPPGGAKRTGSKDESWDGHGPKKRKMEISRGDLADYDTIRHVKKNRHKDKAGEEQRIETAPKQGKKVVKFEETITVGELARQMSLKAGEVVRKLFELGVMATINQALDSVTATLIAEQFGYQVEKIATAEEKVAEQSTKETEDLSKLQPRPPVVTVMGHVDHGKTSLLDAIRQADVAAGEHGGITQHIGAYSVNTKSGKQITFLDTPGHEAFTSMRARGAQVTDIVVLVVAADDGVMPQTKEALNHAQAAKVPIVVAVNKIDKPGANMDRIKQQLSELGLQPEDWGGDVMYFPVSALKKQGIDELLEGLLLLAEVNQFRANADSKALGSIIEARQDRGKGVVATLLVKRGTLRIGDIFVSGPGYGRVRSMLSDTGATLKEATPSTPVEITGFDGMPIAGDDFIVLDSEAEARALAEERRIKADAKAHAASHSGPISLEDFAKRAGVAALPELIVIIKADVQGSVEAVKNSVEQLATDKVKVRVVHAAVGGITESDLQLAIASNAIVFAFNVRAENRVISEAERLGVEIRYYRVIYELVDEVKKAMAGLLAPDKKESIIGRVQVRQVFTVPKGGVIAGCYVENGMVKRGASARILRDSQVVFEGPLASLRRFKDDVREVGVGFECGISVDRFNDIKVGDAMEIFEIKEIAATL